MLPGVLRRLARCPPLRIIPGASSSPVRRYRAEDTKMLPCWVTGNASREQRYRYWRDAELGISAYDGKRESNLSVTLDATLRF